MLTFPSRTLADKKQQTPSSETKHVADAQKAQKRKADSSDIEPSEATSKYFFSIAIALRNMNSTINIFRFSICRQSKQKATHRL